MVPVFKNAGERSRTKNYHPVSLLPVFSNVLEKLAKKKKLVDDLKTFDHFSDFHYGFRPS